MPIRRRHHHRRRRGRRGDRAFDHLRALGHGWPNFWWREMQRCGLVAWHTCARGCCTQHRAGAVIPAARHRHAGGRALRLDAQHTLCDLGLGAGKLEGAFAKLPRYFADADRVMDLEQRLLWCMQNIQGLDTKDVVTRRFSGPGRASDMEDLVAFIANKSSGMKIDIPLSHPKEQEMAAVGEALFYRRGGVNDFACATCHAEEGKRIRLQGLPNLSKPGKQAQETMGSWPTYRVSQGALRTMQHRLWDCYRQQRWPVPEYGSDALTALTVFLQKQAAGGEIAVPSIKR